jgi:hypothetical protein
LPVNYSKVEVEVETEVETEGKKGGKKKKYYRIRNLKETI